MKKEKIFFIFLIFFNLLWRIKTMKKLNQKIKESFSYIFIICIIIFGSSTIFAQGANHIVISRVNANGNEYVELYNPTPYDVDISGWTIRDGTTSDATFPSGTILTAYHYISIGDSGASPDITDAITLTDGGDNVNLYNGTSTVDNVSYGTDTTGTETPAAPGIPNLNDFIERKAISTSTASNLGSGGSHEFLGNGYDSDNNSVDFVYRNTGSYPTPKHITDAEHIQIIKNSDIATTVFSNGDTNNTVMAINVREPDTNHTLKSFKLKWLGTMEYDIDFTNVYLWIDNGVTPNLWDNSDTFLGKLNYNSTDSFTNNSFSSPNIYNTNFVITIDILPSANTARTFKAMIPSKGVYCSSNGACYYSVTNANYQYVNLIVNPPNIVSQGANPDIVALGNITLFTAVVTDGGDGIGNVWIDLSSIGGSSNQLLYDDGSNGDKVALDNTYSFSYTIPLSVSKGPHTLPIYAESSNGAIKSSASIALMIGENNPVIITEVGINNNLNGLDFMEIQNVSTNNVNLNGWAMGDLDNNDPAFVSSDAILRPGEVAIIYNGAGTSEDDSTGRGSNHYWDFYGVAGEFTGTKDEAVLATNNPISSGDLTYVVDALLYSTDGSPSDDSVAVVAGGEWLPDADAANHVYSAANTIFYRTMILDTDTKDDWSDTTAVTPGATPFGYVFFDNTKYYGTNNTATIILGDSELSGASQTITIKSTTDTNGTTLTLYPNSSIWTGVLRFSTSASSPGIIKVSDGDTITAVYVDTNDHDGNPNNDTKTAIAIWYATTPPTISSQQANPSLANNDGTESVLFTAQILDAGDGIGNVWIDLSSIGGSPNQLLYDDGSNGDKTATDNIYSYSYIIPTTSSKGPKSLLLYATSSNNSVTNSVKLNIVIGGIATHPVISEVATKLTNTGDQFVELYNPTSSPIALTSWKLTKKTSTGTEDNLVTSFPAVNIPAYGYLLIVSPGYSTNTNIYPVKGDVVYSTANTTISSVGKNTVLLYNNSGTLIDKLGFDQSADYETDPYVEANPPQGGSFERKAKETSTATTMTDSGVDSANGNGWDTDRNNLDFITRLVADPQNSSSSSETPEDKINITLSQISASTNYPTYKNVTVMAFILVNTSTSNIDTIKITNLGTMNATTDITNMSIWYDVNNDKFWGAGDISIASATYSGGYWTFTNLNAPYGTNFVVTIDIGPLATLNSTFQGKIPVNGIIGVDLTTNQVSALNNEVQTVLRIAPSISSVTTNIDNGTSSVTNNGNTFDLLAVVVEQSNSGRVVIADLSDLNKTSSSNMANTTGSNFVITNIVVDGSTSLGSRIIVVRAYDATMSLVSLATTTINVIGEEPPIITNTSISNSLFYKLDSSIDPTNIKFTIDTKDTNGTTTNNTKIKGVWIDLSSIGGSTNASFSLVSGASNAGRWEYIYPLPATVSTGTFTLTTTVSDKDWGIATTNFIIQIKTNNSPVSVVVTNLNANGNSVVTLNGSGSYDPDGQSITYLWSIESNTTGETITLSSTSSPAPKFTAPNKDGKIVFGLVVTDIYGYQSSKSLVTVNINKVNVSYTLDDTHPENNPILSDENSLKLLDIPAKTVVTIYTITGNKVDDITVPEGQDWVEWQVPDYLASGVYIVFMKAPDGNTKTMKIVIIR